MQNSALWRPIQNLADEHRRRQWHKRARCVPAAPGCYVLSLSQLSPVGYNFVHSRRTTTKLIDIESNACERNQQILKPCQTLCNNTIVGPNPLHTNDDT